MDNSIKKHLSDILTAIDEIHSFFDGKPKLYDDFYSDIRLRRAVERDIEIIGEATNRILKVEQTISITNARKIVNARNWIMDSNPIYLQREYSHRSSMPTVRPARISSILLSTEAILSSFV